MHMQAFGDLDAAAGIIILLCINYSVILQSLLQNTNSLQSKWEHNNLCHVL